MTEYKAFDHPQLKTGDGRILSSLLMAEAQGLIKMTGIDMKTARSSVYSEYARKMEPPLTEGLLLSWIMRDIMAEKKLDGNYHRGAKLAPKKPGPKPGSHHNNNKTAEHPAVVRSQIVTGDGDPFIADHKASLEAYVKSELKLVKPNQTIAFFLDSRDDVETVVGTVNHNDIVLRWKFNAPTMEHFWIKTIGNTVYVHRYPDNE